MGAACGLVVAVLVAFSGPIFGFVDIQSLDAQGKEIVKQFDPISFQWVSPASLVANLVVGTLVRGFFET